LAGSSEIVPLDGEQNDHKHRHNGGEIFPEDKDDKQLDKAVRKP
jgi:hypothetical protein